MTNKGRLVGSLAIAAIVLAACSEPGPSAPEDRPDAPDTQTPTTAPIDSTIVIGLAGAYLTDTLSGLEITIPAGTVSGEVALTLRTGGLLPPRVSLGGEPTRIEMALGALEPTSAGTLELFAPIPSEPPGGLGLYLATRLPELSDDLLWTPASYAAARDGLVSALDVGDLTHFASEVEGGVLTIEVVPAAVDLGSDPPAPTTAQDAANVESFGARVTILERCWEYPLHHVDGSIDPYPDASAVVLVHGWAKDVANCEDYVTGLDDAAPTFEAMLQTSLLPRLGRDRPMYRFSYPSHYSIERSGDWLAARLRALTAAHGVSNIVLIGHSMGGLVARVVQEQHHDVPVSAVLALGSPHLGTPYPLIPIAGMALPAVLTEGGQDLAFPGEFLGSPRRPDLIAFAGDLGARPSSTMPSAYPFGRWHLCAYGRARDRVDYCENDGVVPLSSATDHVTPTYEYTHSEIKDGRAESGEDSVFVEVVADVLRHSDPIVRAAHPGTAHVDGLRAEGEWDAALPVPIPSRRDRDMPSSEFAHVRFMYDSDAVYVLFEFPPGWVVDEPDPYWFSTLLILDSDSDGVANTGDDVWYAGPRRRPVTDWHVRTEGCESISCAEADFLSGGTNDVEWAWGGGPAGAVLELGRPLATGDRFDRDLGRGSSVRILGWIGGDRVYVHPNFGFSIPR